jgi:glucose-1-phosphate thymidylyltransferase
MVAMARAIVLAAGFGTRMGELGRRCPKGLLDLGMGVVMDPILSDLEGSAAVESIVWVTNGRFAEMYRQWLTASRLRTPWVLIDDGVTEPENRLGAIGDLDLALRETGDASALVLGSDNVYSFDVTGALEEMEARDCSVAALLEGESRAALRAANCVEVDSQGWMVRMEEKPLEPWSDLFAPPVYAYTQATLARVSEYLRAGANPDAPGHFLAWLCARERVFGWRPWAGRRLDIGNPEMLQEARSILREGRL